MLPSTILCRDVGLAGKRSLIIKALIGAYVMINLITRGVLRGLESKICRKSLLENFKRVSAIHNLRIFGKICKTDDLGTGPGLRNLFGQLANFVGIKKISDSMIKS